MNWQPRASAVTLDIINCWEEWIGTGAQGSFNYDFEQHQPLWTEFKNHLWETCFHNKCAYCESPAEAYFPEGEHFRPKRTVRVKGAHRTAQPRVQLADGREVEHPGYFWLALNWRNLVPSCPKCNRGAGKGNQFPIGGRHLSELVLSAEEEVRLLEPPIKSPRRQGVLYLSCLDLDARENPLGLLPLNPQKGRDPRDHLTFGVGGIVGAKSEIGEHTIRLFDLKREDLRIARQRQQELLFYRSFTNFTAGKPLDTESWKEGREPHSSAALDYLGLKIREIGEQGK
jgi:hypothetical protein